MECSCCCGVAYARDERKEQRGAATPVVVQRKKEEEQGDYGAAVDVLQRRGSAVPWTILDSAPERRLQLKG